MEKKAFENAKNQIGSCGIWCGSCVAGNGVLQELTKRYNRVITDYGLEQWAPKDFDFSEFKKGLDSIQTMPLCPGCQKGGGLTTSPPGSCIRIILNVVGMDKFRYSSLTPEKSIYFHVFF